MASEGPGSHGTLYAGDRETTVKDRKKEIGKRLLAKVLGDLGIEKGDFWATKCGRCPESENRTNV